MSSQAPLVVEVDFPLYVLSDEQAGDVLVAAEAVEGFFIAPDEESSEVAFLGVHEVGNGGRRVDDAVLDVMNRRREKIGAYFIGRVVFDGASAKVSDGSIPRVGFRVFGNRCEYPGAGAIWQRWASGTAVEKGEWLRWPVSYQSAWLHVVQNSWFTSGRGAARYGVDGTVYLDGAHISTISGLFCALGEAVNGPGGYFGSNLDALADCISSRIGQGPPVRIVWRNFQASRDFLDAAFLDSFAGVMREFDVDFVTS